MWAQRKHLELMKPTATSSEVQLRKTSLLNLLKYALKNSTVALHIAPQSSAAHISANNFSFVREHSHAESFCILHEE